MNYYERHIGDYLKDTSHLSLLEHGIYCRLMDVYYTRECAIPAAGAARLIGARSDEEKAALDTVLREFFVQEDSGDWVQARCEREIAKFQDKQRKAKASAEARWAKPEQESERTAAADQPQTERTADEVPTECDRNATALPTHSEGNAPRARPQTPDTRPIGRARSRKTPLPVGFAISDRVQAWANEKGHRHLEAQFEAFVSYAKRCGATYVDWDEALMTAVRENWAKVNGKERGSDLDEMFRRGRA